MTPTPSFSGLHHDGAIALWNPLWGAVPFKLFRISQAEFVLMALAAIIMIFLIMILRRRVAFYSNELKQREAQLQAIFDRTEEGIAVLDRGHNIVKLNRSAARLLGIKPGALSNERITEQFEVYLPDGNFLPRAEWPSVLALQDVFVHDYEVHIRRTDTGNNVIVLIGTAPIKDRSGETIQVVITYRDVTHPRLIDEARARLAAIVESSEDAIIGKDSDGTITSWNKGAQKIFGYTPAEMLGKSVRQLLPLDLAGEEDEILRRIRSGEIVEHIDTVRVRKDGTHINVSLTISPIRDSTGKIVGASKIARDTTEKRQLERQLRQSLKMEAIGQLTGGIAHDFNNLLGIIMGNLDLLERLSLPSSPGLKFLHTAQKATLRGAELTRRMLTFSSSEELTPRAIALNEAIENTLELAGRAVGPEIRITKRLDATIPPVLADASGLENALLNLMVNARDAMPDGGTLTITTQLCHLDDTYLPVVTGDLKAGEYATISIEDTGVGMSKEVQDRVFEPFFTTKARGKGTGLGLAMVWGFAKQSGGTVRIYSEVGFGTTINIYLPFARNGAPPLKPKAEPVPVATRSGSVLVVDDEEGLLDVASAYLEDMGYTVRKAIDGPSALATMEQSNIDLVITDIIMPGGMNGLELGRAVLRLHPETKIVYCSGFPADALAERNMQTINAPLLLKPYKLDEFRSVILRVMDRPPAE